MPEYDFPWHREVLPDQWARAVDALATRTLLDGFYLAGGTGLALHVGHRRSVDLDLFRESEFASEDLRDRVRNMEGLGKLETERGTVHLQLHGVKVSFLYYPYPLIFPLHAFGALTVADPRDIACMKLDTIATRGTRRDFVDLYVAATTYGLREIFAWFATKYAAVSYNRAHLYKALTYFADAEQEPMPNLLVPLEWSTVRQFFLAEAPRLPRLP